MSPSDIEVRIDSFFDSIKSCVSDEYYDALESCELAASTQGFSKLPAAKVIELLDRFNVSLSSVAKGKVDLEVVCQQLTGEGEIPNKYTKRVPYSLRLSSRIMIDCVSDFLPHECVKELLRSLQLKRSCFKNDSDKNNLLLAHDICEYVHHFHGGAMIERMGERNAESLIENPIGAALKLKKDLKNLMQSFLEEIYPATIGRNYNWNLRNLKNNFFEIEGGPREDVAEMLKQDQANLGSLELLRKGYLRAIPRAVGIDQVVVQQISSMAQGDISDVYRVHCGPQIAL
ncbi:MAG: hypothetical protein KC478_09570 [Bacteriovoracaceae bacterium]|nr:hypothetical protein [Bacteriovoracaceae bacterium]